MFLLEKDTSMGSTASTQKTKTFTLRKDDSLDIPISFDETFIKLLDREGKTSLMRSKAAEPSTTTASVSSTPEKVRLKSIEIRILIMIVWCRPGSYSTLNGLSS